jgi:hypothetical protein
MCQGTTRCKVCCLKAGSSGMCQHGAGHCPLSELRPMGYTRSLGEFRILTAAAMKSAVFRSVTSFDVVEVYRRFRGS